MPYDRISDPSAVSAHVGESAPQNRSLLQDAIHGVTGLVCGDNNSSIRTEVENYTAEAAKAVPLFLMASKGSYGAAAVLYGLDQVHTGDSIGQQITDFGLGAVKGAATKGAFEMIGKSTDLGIAGKGVAMGFSARALDTGLTSGTYYNQQGNFDLLGGLGTVAKTSLNPTALATDAVVFGAAHGLFKGLDLTTSGAISRSPFLTTVATGGTFGFASGASLEIQREQANGEGFNLGKVAMRGAIDAGVMSIAAVPGGVQIARSTSVSGNESQQNSAKPRFSLRNTISDLTGFGG
ncbi:MAG: hypothetical protein ACRD3W_16525 [Terriglobales bacterium]